MAKLHLAWYWVACVLSRPNPFLMASSRISGATNVQWWLVVLRTYQHTWKQRFFIKTHKCNCVNAPILNFWLHYIDFFFFVQYNISLVLMIMKSQDFGLVWSIVARNYIWKIVNHWQIYNMQPVTRQLFDISFKNPWHTQKNSCHGKDSSPAGGLSGCQWESMWLILTPLRRCNGWKC